MIFSSQLQQTLHPTNNNLYSELNLWTLSDRCLLSQLPATNKCSIANICIFYQITTNKSSDSVILMANFIDSTTLSHGHAYDKPTTQVVLCKSNLLMIIAYGTKNVVGF